jgi:ketosteroid isomerase-like protein
VKPNTPILTALTVAALTVTLSAAPAGLTAQSEEAAVIETVDLYHASLAAGDSTTALDLLAEDVTIIESGGVETKEHYRTGHLSGDMRFAQAVPRERGDITVTIVGDVAWAWSTSVTEGMMGEREINSRGAELMVLARVDGAWMIRAIHWSSRQRR